jgi:DNA-binding response OmpR family regulator
MLEDEGFRVSAVGDVATACDILNQGDVALIISDEGLPQNNDPTMAQEAFMRMTPRIAISGSPDHQQALRAAGLDFMPKPFKLAELRRRINEMIGKDPTNS